MTLGNSVRSEWFQNLEVGNSRRRSALIFILIFFALILILSLVQNTEIILVLTLYLSIFLEGISICAFAIYSRSSKEDDFAKKLNRQDQTKMPSSKGSDVVSSMNMYVTYAGRGSIHSRREIAFIIRNVAEDRHSIKLKEFENDPTFQADCDQVVNRYVRGYDEENKRNRRKETKREKDAYLTSLERIVVKLRT